MTTKVSTEAEYWTVRMGPIPGTIAWHEEVYADQAYQFPSEESARLFAEANQDLYPNRKVEVLPPRKETP